MLFCCFFFEKKCHVKNDFLQSEFLDLKSYWSYPTEGCGRYLHVHFPIKPFTSLGELCVQLFFGMKGLQMREKT